MKLRILLLLCGLLLFWNAPTETTLACSGPGQSPLQTVFEVAETAVIGTFVEFDTYNYNAVFQVQSYLMGEPGPEYILLALNDPVLIEDSLQVRSRSGQCPRIQNLLDQTEVSILFLNRQIDGSYTWMGRGSGLYQFEMTNTVLPIFYEIVPTAEQPYIVRDFTQSELRRYIFGRTGQKPHPPLFEQPYPTKTPLMITTDTGNQYLLSIDGSNPVLLTDQQVQETQPYPTGCSPAPCNAQSPNRLDIAELRPNDEPAEEWMSLITDSRHLPIFQGEALLFSPTSYHIAVWDKNSIEVHTLYYPHLGISEGDSVSLVNTMPLNLEGLSDFQPGTAAWSPDGRFLAYTDSAGLWLWDVFALGRSATLLINASNHIPYARYFSPLGRYLAVTEGQERYTIDIFTGDRLPDGLVSPDDRNLLAFDTTATGEFELSLVCLAPIQTDIIEPIQQVRRVEWINNSTFIMFRCGHGYNDEQLGYIDEDYCVIGENMLPMISMAGYFGYDFDYKPETKQLAIVVDANQIRIDGENKDLTDLIEGAITHIQWLPSLFHNQSYPPL